MTLPDSGDIFVYVFSCQAFWKIPLWRCGSSQVWIKGMTIICTVKFLKCTCLSLKPVDLSLSTLCRGNGSAKVGISKRMAAFWSPYNSSPVWASFTCWGHLLRPRWTASEKKSVAAHLLCPKKGSFEKEIPSHSCIQTFPRFLVHTPKLN